MVNKLICFIYLESIVIANVRDISTGFSQCFRCVNLRGPFTTQGSFPPVCQLNGGWGSVEMGQSEREVCTACVKARAPRAALGYQLSTLKMPVGTQAAATFLTASLTSSNTLLIHDASEILFWVCTLCCSRIDKVVYWHIFIMLVRATSRFLIYYWIILLEGRDRYTLRWPVFIEKILTHLSLIIIQDYSLFVCLKFNR